MSQKTFTVSAVPGAGSKTQAVTAVGGNLAYLTRINVIPSAAGDSYQVQFFRDDAHTAGNLNYDSGAVSGTHEDPIQSDDGVETQHGQDALIISVARDDDATSEWHVKVTNNDASARDFDFVVDYILPVDLDTSGNLTIAGSLTAVSCILSSATPLVFEGATANDFETSIAVTDPTADRTITLPDATGTVALIGHATQTGTLDVSTLDAATALTVGAIHKISTTELTLNEDAGDRNLRVESVGNANMFFLDAGLNMIAIGHAAPGTLLDIRGSTAAINFTAGTDAASTLNLLNTDATIDTGPVITFASYYNANNTVALASIAAKRDLGAGSTADAGNAALVFSTTNDLVLGEGMRLTNEKNLGLGVTTFGTSAAKVFSLGTGTAPSSGVADSVQIFSRDLSAGNTMLSIYTEGTPVGSGTPTADRTVALSINGTTYYLLASTVAS